MKKEALTDLDLRSVVHKQGISNYKDVEKCVLEPNGTFYVEAKSPSSADAERTEVMAMMRSLSTEVRELKALLEAQG